MHTPESRSRTESVDRENPYQPGEALPGAAFEGAGAGRLLTWMANAAVLCLVVQRFVYRGMLPDPVAFYAPYVLLATGIGISLLIVAFWIRTRRHLYIAAAIANWALISVPWAMMEVSMDARTLVAGPLNFASSAMFGAALLTQRFQGPRFRLWALRIFGTLSVLSMPLIFVSLFFNWTEIVEDFEHYRTLMTFAALVAFLQFPFKDLVTT